MTEMETLKKEADRQKAEQRHKAVGMYIDSLLKRMDAQFSLFKERSLHAFYALLPTSVIWGLNFFVESPYVMIGAIVGMVATWHLFTRVGNTMQEVEKTMAEIDGCFKTLELLGLLPPEERGRKYKKPRVSLLAQFWESAKQMTRAKTYAPKPV